MNSGIDFLVDEDAIVFVCHQFDMDKMKDIIKNQCNIIFQSQFLNDIYGVNGIGDGYLAMNLSLPRSITNAND